MKSNARIASLSFLMLSVLVQPLGWANDENNDVGPGDPVEEPPSPPPPPATGHPLAPVTVRAKAIFDEGFPFVLIGRGFDGIGIGSEPAPSAPAPAPADNSPPKPDKNCETSAHPVVYATGNKVKDETDFVSSHQHPIELSRHYNRLSKQAGIFGPNWFSSFDGFLSFAFTNGGSCTASPGLSATCITSATPSSSISVVTSTTADGGQHEYKWDGATGRWTSSFLDATEYVTREADGTWSVVGRNGSKETYNPSGFITSSVDPTGVGYTYSYTANLLQRATHSSGKYVQFGWTGRVVTSVTDPGGNVYGYGYTAGMLNTVSFPGSPASTRTYHYESAVPEQLTGISNNGARYSNYDYHPDGRAFHSGLVSGEKDTFVYGTNADGTTYTEVTNRNGAITRYTYSSRRPVRVDRSGVTNCPNAAAQTVYDTNGFIDYSVDFNGNRTDYTYTATGQLEDFTTGIRADKPGQQRFTDYVWDATKNRVTAVRTYGASTSDPLAETVYEYYPDGTPSQNRIKSVTVVNKTSNGVAGQTRKTSFAYTFHPNKLIDTATIDGPRTDVSDVSTIKFDASGNLVSKTNALGQQTAYAGHDGLGLPATTTDPNAFVVSRQYDARGRVWKVTRTLDGIAATTTTTYDVFGNPAKTIFADGGEINWVYDAAGQLIYRYSKPPASQVTPAGTNQAREIYVWTEGRLTSRKLSTGLLSNGIFTPQADVFSQVLTYDSLDRLLERRGNNGQVFSQAYDQNGNIRQRKDTEGRTWDYSYNAHDEIESETNPQAETIHYGYDASGSIRTVTDARGKVAEMRRDGFRQVVNESIPDAGAKAYVYDAAGNLILRTFADGSQTTYSYDALNRVKQIAAPGQAITYTYDTCGNGKGRLCSITDSSGSTAYTYRANGQLASQTSVVAAASYLVSWSYDSVDRVSSITYPGGMRVNYGYSIQSNVTSVTATIGGITRNVATTFAYQAMGMGARSGMTMGDGTRVDWNRDQDSRLRGKTATGLSGLSYDYDVNDRMRAINDTLVPANSQAISYDDVYQVSGITSTGLGNESIYLLPNGNRGTHIWGGATDSYNIDPNSNRILNILGPRARTFSHDARGNRKTATGWPASYTYGYDALNRLQTVTSTAGTTTYTYNALNQRARKAGAAGSYNYIFDQRGTLLGETANGGTTLNTLYIWLQGEPIGIVRSGNLHLVFNDHLGRPNKVTTPSKTVVWSALNKAFERVVSLDTFGGLNFGFPGQYWDQESALFYNINRYYDPRTGRYTQSDPIGISSGANTYTYVGGDPITQVDPLGLAYFALRPLQGFPWLGPFSDNPLDNAANTAIAHEQLFFEDGKSPANIGFFGDSKLKTETSLEGYRRAPGNYNDCLMRLAAQSAGTGTYNAATNNCQSWADRVRNQYNKLLHSGAAAKACGL